MCSSDLYPLPSPFRCLTLLSPQPYILQKNSQKAQSLRSYQNHHSSTPLQTTLPIKHLPVIKGFWGFFFLFIAFLPSPLFWRAFTTSSGPLSGLFSNPVHALSYPQKQPFCSEPPTSFIFSSPSSLTLNCPHQTLLFVCGQVFSLDSLQSVLGQVNKRFSSFSFPRLSLSSPSLFPCDSGCDFRLRQHERHSSVGGHPVARCDDSYKC